MERTGDPLRTRRSKETREVVRCLECGAPVRLDDKQPDRLCAKCVQEPASPQLG